MNDAPAWVRYVRRHMIWLGKRSQVPVGQSRRERKARAQMRRRLLARFPKRKLPTALRRAGDP